MSDVRLVPLRSTRTLFPISVEFRSSLVSSNIIDTSGAVYSHRTPVGFSDPLYAEAYVKVHGFDIMLGACDLSWAVTERATQTSLFKYPPRCPIGQPDIGYATKPVFGFRDSR